jgi:hypothetical protein
MTNTLSLSLNETESLVANSPCCVTCHVLLNTPTLQKALLRFFFYHFPQLCEISIGVIAGP